MYAALLALLPPGPLPDIAVTQTDDYVQIDTDALQARINKKGYVSGVARGTLLDKKTGAREAGFGLHIMDFLLAPGWADDGYPRNPSCTATCRNTTLKVRKSAPRRKS